MKIPKKIHQIAIQGKSFLSDDIRSSIEGLRNRNPTWEYELYAEPDILDYIVNFYGEDYKNLYLKINPQYMAAKADFFRYLLIYNEGGVYLDLKSTCLYPFDEVIDQNSSFIICAWDNLIGEEHEGFGRHAELNMLEHGEFIQWCIIAEPKNIFIKNIIDDIVFNINNYTPWTYGVGGRGVLKTTGPIPFSLSIIRTLRYSDNFDEFGCVFVRNFKSLGLRYISSDRNEHFSNKDHYSNKLAPIVMLNGRLYFLSTIYTLLVRIRRLFKRR